MWKAEVCQGEYMRIKEHETALFSAGLPTYNFPVELLSIFQVYYGDMQFMFVVLSVHFYAWMLYQKKAVYVVVYVKSA